jgi:adenosylcobinamide-phosphate synthase
VSYAIHLSTPLILYAIAVDAILGDPEWLPHPVRLIGASITRGDALLWSGTKPSDLRNGAILMIAVVAASAASTWALVILASWAGTWAAAAVAVILAWTTIALRGLDSAAAAVERALRAGDLGRARREIRALVGRDPDSLDQGGLIRAAVESVAENCSDGVIAPMLYLFAGGPVAAMAYKAINTLDSMIGYEDERYRWFGRNAARLDDLANLLPARITAVCLIAASAVISRRPTQAYAACAASGSLHPSPNAGYPESAMAGALGIELGGDAVYRGEVEHRPALGINEREPMICDIANARAMMRLASMLAFGSFALGRMALLPILGWMFSGERSILMKS